MHYVEVSLELLEKSETAITPTILKRQLVGAIKEFVGCEGTDQQVDVIRCDSKNRRFILRCESEFLVKLRASLTVATIFWGIPCIWKVIRSTPNLLSLAVDSRTFVH